MTPTPPRPERRAYTLGGRLVLWAASCGSPASETAAACGLDLVDVHASVRRDGWPLPFGGVDLVAAWLAWCWMGWSVRAGVSVSDDEVVDGLRMVRRLPGWLSVYRQEVV